MAKIDVGQADHADVKPKVDQLVNGRDFPLQVTLNHKRKAGVVLPIIGVYDIIPQETDYPIVLWSYQQAWDMVSQVAHIAQLFKVDQFASIADHGEAVTEVQSVQSVESAPAESQAAAPATAPSKRNKEPEVKA